MARRMENEVNERLCTQFLCRGGERICGLLCYGLFSLFCFGLWHVSCTMVFAPDRREVSAAGLAIPLNNIIEGMGTYFEQIRKLVCWHGVRFRLLLIINYSGGYFFLMTYFDTFVGKHFVANFFFAHLINFHEYKKLLETIIIVLKVFAKYICVECNTKN